MNSRKFAVLILTHGRANNIYTDVSLRKHGYTGDIYYVIDDEDEQEKEYKERYSDKVIVFNKQKYIDKLDTMNPEAPRKVILYARNACFDIAEQLGLTHFLELDDDYTEWQWRYPQSGVLKTKDCFCLDKCFDIMLDFLDSTPALSVALAQGGDFIGGINGRWKDRILRKAMNSFFCRIDRRFDFLGAMNEDVNAYVRLGGLGHLFFTETLLSLHQKETQSNAGGMTDIYLYCGTYVKSFYSVMVAPSCVKISCVGNKYMRVHHRVKWDNAVPKILSSDYKKAKV